MSKLLPVPTPEVLAAFEHVRKLHPSVVLVVYTPDQRWHYLDEDFDAPAFSSDVDVGLLDEAIDSLPSLPAVFALNEKEVW